MNDIKDIFSPKKSEQKKLEKIKLVTLMMTNFVKRKTKLLLKCKIEPLKHRIFLFRDLNIIKVLKYY